MGSEGTSLHIRFDRKDSESLKAISAVDLCPSAIPGKTLGDLVTIGGETVTELVKKGNVARFNFFGNTMVFHVDDPDYLAKIKNEHLEFVILPGFRWMNWHQDDWGNWAGANKNNYTPVEGTLVTHPIAFYLNEKAEVCVKSEGLQIVEGYKDTYFVGERIDMTTLLIRMSQGGEPMHILEEMVSYDFSKAGTATVTVTVKGMTATYTVTVVEDPNTEAPTEEVTDPVTEPSTETPTEAPTDPVTEEPTAPVTEAPTETPTETPTEGETAPAEKKGCGATLTALTAVTVILTAAVALKKKED
jgi:hypothetical protein